MINWYPGLTLKEMEKQVIEKAMRFFDGNKTKTAQALGIAIRTLDARLEEYGEKEKPDPNQTTFEIPPVTIDVVIPDPSKKKPVDKIGEIQVIKSDSQPERRRR